MLLGISKKLAINQLPTESSRLPDSARGMLSRPFLTLLMRFRGQIGRVPPALLHLQPSSVSQPSVSCNIGTHKKRTETRQVCQRLSERKLVTSARVSCLKSKGCQLCHLRLVALHPIVFPLHQALVGVIASGIHQYDTETIYGATVP